MIRSRADYAAYLEADRLALGRERSGLAVRLVRLIAPDYILKFQRLLRLLEYHRNVRNRTVLERAAYLYLRLRYRRLSVKLGFTIPENVFGPGLAIVHYGTIVINPNARIGSNCRIHPGTSIGASAGSDRAPQLGDNVYIAPGVKIFGDINVPSNTAIGANAVLAESFSEEGTMLAGVPARRIKAIDIKLLIKHI
jgi:serine O-acetyltransferase